MQISPRPLLAKIDSPDDVKKLDQAQLVQLCDELRHFIIDIVSVYGGHFGASLGVVELTVALHYVYNTPEDLVVWDVGHQLLDWEILLHVFEFNQCQFSALRIQMTCNKSSIFDFYQWRY